MVPVGGVLTAWLLSLAVLFLPDTAARILLVKLGCAATVVTAAGCWTTPSSCSGPSSGMVGWLNDLLECFLQQKLHVQRSGTTNSINILHSTPVVGQVGVGRVARFPSMRA